MIKKMRTVIPCKKYIIIAYMYTVYMLNSTPVQRKNIFISLEKNIFISSLN